MKILVVSSRFPFPLEKGDKLRVFQFIKYLSKEHDVFLFSITDAKVYPVQLAELKKYCKDIRIFQRKKIFILTSLIKAIFKNFPFQVEYFYSKKAQKQIDEFFKRINPDVVFCQLIRTAEYVKKFKVVKILDYMDAFSKGLERRMAIEPFYFKYVLKKEFIRVKKYECELFDQFEYKVIISETDKNFISHVNNSDIKVIPNGVNFDYFKSINEKKIYDIVFAGNMSYPPNVKAVLFLAKVIVPKLIEFFPNLIFLIAGANPKKEILKLKSKNIVITGWVDDIRKCYGQSKIMVAPLFIGTGLQNKILEAMAMRVPCITSSLVNSAINAMPGKEVMIADTEKEYLECIVKLINDPLFSKEISENAYQFVEKKYQWENILNDLDILLQKM